MITYGDLYNFLMKLNQTQLNVEAAFHVGGTTYNLDSMDIEGKTNPATADEDLIGLTHTGKPLAPYGANSREDAVVSAHLNTGYDVNVANFGTVTIVAS
jgi:hypothetical protein